jgi:hypothetical protein
MIQKIRNSLLPSYLVIYTVCTNRQYDLNSVQTPEEKKEMRHYLRVSILFKLLRLTSALIPFPHYFFLYIYPLFYLSSNIRD